MNRDGALCAATLQTSSDLARLQYLIIALVFTLNRKGENL